MANENKNKNLVILAVVIVLFVVGIFMAKNNNTSKVKNLTAVEAKTKIEAFIKSDLLTDGTKFTIADGKDFNAGLYEFDITIADAKEPIKSYVTKDGKLFIPQAMPIEPKATSTAAATDTAKKDPAAAATPATKSDKPKVEVFVMSHCPYGTQIEKGILPVAEALKGKIDFKIKFVDYAMHGEKELKEELRQYCIDKEQNGAYFPYLKCFLKAGDDATCLKEAKIDTKKLDACYTATDKQYSVLDTFAKGQSAWGSQFPPFNIYKDDNTKYGVQGSPTLVINGKEASAGRDSASLAKAICDAFTDGKKPAACDQTFASASPTPGFGEGTQAPAAGGAAAPAAGCGQ